MNKKTHFGFQEVDEADKSKFVGDVFTSVAKNYDVMNEQSHLVCIGCGKKS
ncbi:MAG: hypothetical protein Ct9H90mP22_3570 [Gammaproteobacteria bacterium]|nr:MAG: hypothetical protein Ct9H90mP22_3570 [Gammaproteobacteria bacterium]